MNMKEMEENYKKSIQIMDEGADLANAGDLANALVKFKESCQLSPQNIKAFINTAQCLVYMDRHAEAKPYIVEARTLIETASKIGIGIRERKRLSEFKSILNDLEKYH